MNFSSSNFGFGNKLSNLTILVFLAVSDNHFVKVDGITQPAPAPRFSRTPGRVHTPPAKPGEHTEEVLEEWGFDKEKISSLKESAVVGRL